MENPMYKQPGVGMQIALWVAGSNTGCFIKKGYVIKENLSRLITGSFFMVQYKLYKHL